MEGKKKDVTIYDLAHELNVSPSTVSRALNDHYSIGKKTKKAVKQLAEERGYRPNTIASSLRTNRSNTIGIMVSWINRPFISSLISGIEKAARESGHQVIISQSYDKPELEKDNLQALYDSRISALIVSLAMGTTDYQHFDLFTNNGIPVVFVDRIPSIHDVHKVHINNFNAAFEATEHLIDQGCTRIAHFGGARHQSIYEDRRSGYIAALKKNNVDVDESLIIQATSLNAEEGLRLTEQVLELENPPDGIFCANDTAAVSAIQYAKKMGIRIPEELAIIGFNNDPICEIIDPPLSSVDHPAVEMGEAAIKQALAMLEGEIATDSATRVTLDTQVVVRASSLRKG
ncbi:LacI family DNA-binding transcriptional regulator [Flavilitoribacter nigricans]|uniref:LacI family transcriptional regulator n=1 Tax=Flavilitoribacter nigricans (strain ATCC 23147 / DSM 23189 / NBRC 102662 / NCIMB 1420 / SS-2) TaxID=1122177 RepID=A0A2D0N1P3_FLAN2|nr:LacI family DNA-binding transcriptional regulator [Flavilitoribacter nigricans]PHN01633.1 LacI family transcriptional regulator [Flavilitoribacter nigricans DSM 23189 = NBRC 102662]